MSQSASEASPTGIGPPAAVTIRHRWPPDYTPPPGGGPFVATRFTGLARGALAFQTGKALKITSAGASQDLATKVSAVGVSACNAVAPDATNPAVFSTTLKAATTLIGRPALTAKIVTKGKNGQLDVRLWDLDPAAGTQQFITRGVYRLTDDQKGPISLDLDGNGWRFPKGHRVVVELLGRDAPTYQPSTTPFSATLTSLRISLPTR